MMNKRQHQLNEELICFGIFEDDTLTVIIDTVRNLNNRATAIGSEILGGT